MKKILAVLSVSVCLGSPLAQAETLLQAYREAEANNPQFRIADTERLAVLEQRTQVQSRLLPSVELSGNVNKQFADGNSSDAFTSGYTVDLAYPIFKRDNQIEFERAEKRIEKSEVNYLDAQQNLMILVALRYFDVLAAQDNLGFSRANKNAIKKHLDQSQQRFDVGLIAITDVQESQARYDLATAEEISAQKNLSIAREAAREVTNLSLEKISPLSQELPLKEPNPADVDTWVTAALENNPALRAAHYDVEIAMQAIDISRAGHLPVVNIVGRHAYNDSDAGGFGGGYSHVNSVGVQVRVPLYVGGAIKAQTREAGLRHQQALDTVEANRRAVERDTRDAYLSVIAAISRVKALAQAVKSSQTAYDATQTGFDVGTRTAVEVLDSQRDLLAAQRDYARARYDYVLSTLQLKRASGQLTIADLEALEQWFIN